jgi:hypothetical protein
MTLPSRKGKAKRRQHTYRRPKTAEGARLRTYSRCPQCGKWCFAARADAEAAVRVVHPGATMRFYRCGASWHYTSMTAFQVEEIRVRRAEELEEYYPGEQYDYPEETAC